MSNSQQPLVSIVIPAYNGLPYLEEAIQSVLSQTYPNIELIVLNDGSKDKTAEFLNKYQGQFYFETHANMGQAATLNKGWQMSRGEILGYLSADDILAPDAVKLSVTELLDHPEIILTYGDNILIDNKSRHIRRVNALEYNYVSMVKRSTSQIGVGSFFRKKTFERVGGWNKAYRFIPDYDFQLRLAELGAFKAINKVVGYYRVHDQSSMYRGASFEVANEFIVVMEIFLANTKSLEILSYKKMLLANAYLWSARTHWRSGRYKVGANYFLKSIRLFPRNLLSPKTYRIILNALINRNLHKLMSIFKDWKARTL